MKFAKSQKLEINCCGKIISGVVERVGRRYVYVRIEFTYSAETVPFEIDIRRTSQAYEDRNGLPMHIMSIVMDDMEPGSIDIDGPNFNPIQM